MLRETLLSALEYACSFRARRSARYRARCPLNARCSFSRGIACVFDMVHFKVASCTVQSRLPPSWESFLPRQRAATRVRHPRAGTCARSPRGPRCQGETVDLAAALGAARKARGASPPAGSAAPPCLAALAAGNASLFKFSAVKLDYLECLCLLLRSGRGAGAPCRTGTTRDCEATGSPHPH